MPSGSSSTRADSVERPSRTTKKRITEEEWQTHKRTISRLYLDEGRDVREVRDTMKREFGFDAHEKAYKRKFDEWGFIKNIPKEEGLFMVQKREQRRNEGKETVFRRRRRPDGPPQIVPDEKIDRIADRYSHDLNNYPSGAATPPNIEYGSPQPTPPRELMPQPGAEADGVASSSMSHHGLPSHGLPSAIQQGHPSWGYAAIPPRGMHLQGHPHPGQPLHPHHVGSPVHPQAGPAPPHHPHTSQPGYYMSSEDQGPVAPHQPTSNLGWPQWSQSPQQDYF